MVDPTMFQRGLANVRKFEGDMTLRRLQILLAVYQAAADGIDMSSLFKTLDMGAASGSKLVQSWSHLTADKRRGPAYMVARANPENLATKRVTITDRGQRAVQRILDE